MLFSDYVYIDRLTISNLRCLEQAEIDFCYLGKPGLGTLKHPNVNLLLGNNGAGKSTVLMATALSALAPIMGSSGFVAKNLIRQGQSVGAARARIVLDAQDAPDAKQIEREAKLKRAGDFDDIERYVETGDPFAEALLDDHSASFFLVGYGSSRRTESAANFNPERLRSRRGRYLRVAGLFEPPFALTPMTHWYDDAATKTVVRDREVRAAFERLLPENVRFTGKRREGSFGEFLFEVDGEEIPFDALSDGYRGYVGWVADLLFHLTAGRTGDYDLQSSTGVVIVDEIDLHLHPEWQRTVVARVAEALPRIQFLFSTHSPIVAGSVEGPNVFVMDRAKSGAAVVKRLEDSLYGLDALQVLQSPAFGLVSTRVPAVAREIRELAVKATTDVDAALLLMKRMAGRRGA